MLFFPLGDIAFLGKHIKCSRMRISHSLTNTHTSTSFQRKRKRDKDFGGDRNRSSEGRADRGGP